MNVTVRRLKATDVYKLQSIVKKDIAEAAYIPWPFTKVVALSFINDYNTWGIWINGGILAGAIEIKDTHETAYLVAGIYQNNGIATAAIKEIKEIFYDRQLWCMINPNNKASLKVANNANMRVQFYR
jgi:hypothetical protein